MYLSIIKNFINKFKTKKRRKNIKNKLLLNKIEQTSFIKKRKTIKFNNINFKKFWFKIYSYERVTNPNAIIYRNGLSIKRKRPNKGIYKK